MKILDFYISHGTDKGVIDKIFSDIMAPTKSADPDQTAPEKAP